MNALVVGSNKQPILRYIPSTFLIIDDGPVIDALTFPKRKAVTHFDVSQHTFNPLNDIDYRKARQFIAILNAVFPEGASTLTKRNSDFVLLNALLGPTSTLDRLIRDSKETRDAFQKIQTLLLSPVLKRVLNRPTNMSFKGTIVAKLDRAALGDFDCFVVGNLLASQYQGTVVIPDFGFYASPFHASLIRQDRLIAGISAFDEVPDLRSQLILIDEKIGSRCTPDDAKLLALYAGIPAGTNAYNDFIERSIGGNHAAKIHAQFQ